MMAALERLRKSRGDLTVNVVVLATVGKEQAFTGVLSYIESDATATAAVGGELTDLRIATAHKECVRGYDPYGRTSSTQCRTGARNQRDRRHG